MKVLFTDLEFKEFNFGYISFLVGLFLLPSALAIGVIFLIIAIIFGFKEIKQNFIKDKFNLFLNIGAIFLCISSLINFVLNKSIVLVPYLQTYSARSLSLIGLVNWIPLIFAYNIFQNYLSTSEERRRCAIVLITGSMPIFFSCFSQFLFDWDETLKTFYGLIVWYQKTLNQDVGISGISGLFSNPNYLGAWLIIIWPFCLSFLLENTKKILTFFKILLVILVGFLIVLSSSRAALLFLILSLPIIYRVKIRKMIAALSVFFIFGIINLSFPTHFLDLQTSILRIVPRGIWLNFTQTGYQYKLEYGLSRIDIWTETLKLIVKRPYLGFGSNTFSSIFFDATGYWKGHSHNLPIELMFNYGIPTALLILIPIIFIIYSSFKKAFILNIDNEKISIIDRGWVLALVSIAGIHLFDIQYFDARISITSWVLLAGARSIIKRE